MYLITWITTHLPTFEGWIAELAKAQAPTTPSFHIRPTDLLLSPRLYYSHSGKLRLQRATHPPAALSARLPHLR